MKETLSKFLAFAAKSRLDQMKKAIAEFEAILDNKQLENKNDPTQLDMVKLLPEITETLGKNSKSLATKFNKLKLMIEDRTKKPVNIVSPVSPRVKYDTGTLSASGKGSLRRSSVIAEQLWSELYAKDETLPNYVNSGKGNIKQAKKVWTSYRPSGDSPVTKPVEKPIVPEKTGPSRVPNRGYNKRPLSLPPNTLKSDFLKSRQSQSQLSAEKEIPELPSASSSPNPPILETDETKEANDAREALDDDEIDLDMLDDDRFEALLDEVLVEIGDGKNNFDFRANIEKLQDQLQYGNEDRQVDDSRIYDSAEESLVT